MEAPHLAKDARLRRRVPRRAVSGLGDLILVERRRAPSDRAEQVGHPFPGREPLRLDLRGGGGRVAVLERVEGALIVLDRVRVGIHAARPVTRGHQVPRAPAGVSAEREVMTEGHEPLETLRTARALRLERRPHTVVQLGATGHEDVLVHDLLEEPVPEAVIRFRRHQIGGGEGVERRVHRAGFGRDRLEQRNLEAGPDHRRFLDDPSVRGVEPVQAREQQAVQGGGHLRGRGFRGAAPRQAVTDQHPRREQGAHHLLEVQRVAAGPLQDQGPQVLREEVRRVTEPRGQEVLAVGP